MAIPDYQELMLPFLRLASNGVEQKFRDAVERLAADYKLTNEERAAMLPSGTAPVFDNRVGWARTYLKQAGLVESPRRGTFRITDEGTALLKENPTKIDVSLLHRYPKFREFLSRRREDKEPQETSVREAKQTLETDLSVTPEDSLASAYSRIRKGLEADLLEQVKKASPSFFERLVVDLLVKMGYGGNRLDAGRAVGRSGDDGIDGIITKTSSAST